MFRFQLHTWLAHFVVCLIWAPLLGFLIGVTTGIVSGLVGLDPGINVAGGAIMGFSLAISVPRVALSSYAKTNECLVAHLNQTPLGLCFAGVINGGLGGVLICT